MPISWMHLTDWHIGQSGEKERFPNLEEIFFDDLKITLGTSNGLDLVFFTGDFVNCGRKEEYDELEKRLIRFWDEFRKYGKEPKLVVVPGNHDLARPSEFSSIALALKNWDQNQELRSAFWEEEAKDLRQEVIDCFTPYTNWLKTTSIPLLETTAGVLPGDQLGTYSNDDLTVSLLGLNTTYLQCRKGDFEGKLWLSPKQIPHTTQGTYLNVLRTSDVAVLLTHQPENWLSSQAKADFRSDISRNGVFDAHFCGHLHSPMTVSLSEGGSEHRHTIQGASFFGLDEYGEGGSEHKRIHGYTVGVWNKIDGRIQEKRWPRIAVKKQDGGWGLVQDPSSYLTSDGFMERSWNSRVASPPSQALEEVIPTESTINSPDFFEALPTAALASLPRLQSLHCPQHQAIRAEERQKLQSLLQNTSVIGIVADWGMGTDEFITGAIFGSDSPQTILNVAKKENIFVLNCDAFENAADFEVGFKQQFGVTLHQFTQTTSNLEWACLVLDGMQQDVLEGREGEKFRAIVGIVSDYTQNLRILITGRTETGGGLPTVHLANLDLPETRAYLEAHPKSRPDLLTVEAVERIHFASGGLPIQIDSLLSRLEIASLDAVLEEHITIEEGTSLHKSLLSCIRRLGTESDDDGPKRSLELLRALSSLPYGATIELIKRFNPTRPFYPTQAEELRRLTLIDAIPLHSDVAGVSGNPTKGCSPAISPKILRVPKQVRDCVISDMPQAERKRYIDLAAEFIFGDKWKSGGKIKLKKLPFEYQEYLGRGLGNEYAVIHSLISLSLDEDNQVGIKRALRLALHYCGVLRSAERYKDLKVATGSILHLIDSLDFDTERKQLHCFCGRACRLTGFYGDAIRHFEAAQALWPSGEKDDQFGRMLLELSISYRAENRQEEAKSAAETAATLAKSGSLLESQAKLELAQHADIESKKEALATLEHEARKNQSWQSHANDLALILVNWAKENEKIDLLDRVIHSEKDGRNRYRAIVAKGKLLLKMGMPERLSLPDEVCLIKAYQYFHSQRLSLFEDCHEVIWAILEKRRKFEALYSLFRHSSFIWRLEGNGDQELRYFKRLNELESLEKLEPSSGFVVEVAYFLKRAKVLVIKLIPNSSRPLA